MAGRTRLISRLLLVGDRGTLQSMWGDGSCGGKLLTVARLPYPPHFIWIPAKLLLSRGPPHVFLFVRPRRACSTLFPFLSGSLKVEKKGGGGLPSLSLLCFFGLLFRFACVIAHPGMTAICLSLLLPRSFLFLHLSRDIQVRHPLFSFLPPPSFCPTTTSLKAKGRGQKVGSKRVNQAPLQHSRCRQPTVFLLPPSQTVVEV